MCGQRCRMRAVCVCALGGNSTSCYLKLAILVFNYLQFGCRIFCFICARGSSSGALRSENSALSLSNRLFAHLCSGQRCYAGEWRTHYNGTYNRMWFDPGCRRENRKKNHHAAGAMFDIDCQYRTR